MTCPSCRTVIAKADLRINDTIGVCPTCARSLVKDHGQIRLARAEDVRGLTAGQISDLRQARPAAWRNDVRARHAGIAMRGRGRGRT